MVYGKNEFDYPFNRQLLNDTIQISQGNVFKIGKLNISVQLYLDDH